jgi:hypothetical protein
MVYLRAGQSVGRTQECSMEAEQVGDALVMVTGRVHMWPDDDMMHRVPHGFVTVHGEVK